MNTNGYENMNEYYSDHDRKCEDMVGCMGLAFGIIILIAAVVGVCLYIF